MLARRYFHDFFCLHVVSEMKHSRIIVIAANGEKHSMSHSYPRRIKTRHTGLVTHSVMGNLDCLKCVSFSTKGLKYLKLFIDSVSKNNEMYWFI